MEVKINKKLIDSGIYVVINPAIDEQVLLEKLQIILTKDIAAVQIWDNLKSGQNVEERLEKIHALCKKHQTRVLINNRWDYLKTIDLDGIHFDQIPANLYQIKKEVDSGLIFGLTCENDLADVRWAAGNDFDYISFCAMFPSESAGDCEIVDHQTVEEASRIFDNPLFLSGGISPENLPELDNLKFDGVAVISGIMNAKNPDQAIDQYLKNLK